MNAIVNNGGTAMRTLIVTLFLATLANLVACASDTETTISGTPNVNVDGNVNTTGGNHVADWDPSQCFSDEDCGFNELCVIAPEASEQLGLDVYRCEAGCDAKFSTILNEDGTSVTSKAGDSCQRFNDLSVYCDMDAEGGPVCTKYTVPPVEEPVEPVLPQFVKVSCCFNAAVISETMFAQLAWSTSEADNPKGFGKDGDISLDDNGCFVSEGKVARANLYLGFWTELTDGTAADGQWLGSGSHNEYAPSNCTVDDIAVDIGAHMQSCGFGLGDAVLEDGSSANCLE